MASTRTCVVVGYGLRGRQWAATAARRRDLVLTGVVDPQPGARSEAERAGLRAWPSLDEALAEAHPDAAVIASPPQEHPDQAIACVREGVRVLVEKPLATSADAARRVSEEAEHAGVRGLVAQNFRFRRRELAVQTALAHPALGRLRGATVMTARPARVMRESTRVLAHAPLWDLGIHHLDLLRVRFGRAPEEIRAHCAGGTYTIQLDWEGAAPVLYRLVEGAPVFSHFEWLQGDGGAVQMLGSDIRLLRPGRRYRRSRRVRLPRSPAPRDVLLARLVGSDERAEPSLADNVETVAMVEMAIRALEGSGAPGPGEIALA